MGYEAMPDFFSTYICMKTVWLESMRQKLVTLDPTSFETSKQMKNFSAWVRMQLIHYNNGYTIESLMQECDRIQQLLSDIIDGKKVWKNGFGWVVVE